MAPLDPDDVENRLGTLESRITDLDELETHMRDAGEAIGRLVYAVNELIDDNDLTATDELNAAIERAEMLARLIS